MSKRKDTIEQTVANQWNVRDEYKSKSLDELRGITLAQNLPFAVCAINVTGDLNLGMMMRTACLAGAERFIIYGKHGYDRRTTVGADKYIEIVKCGSIARNGSLEIDWVDFFPLMRRYGYQPIFLETGYPSIYDFDPTKLRMLQKPCLVFGNEGVGIDFDLLCGQPHIYSVPQRGVLRSYNVSSAAAIAIAHVARCFENVSIV